MKILRSLFICLAVLTLLLGSIASSHATNGYFAHGFSTKNKALAGAGTALPLDSIAASTNPAGMVRVGSRLDVGISLFNPNREYTVTGSVNAFPAFSLDPGTVESDSKWFVIPSLGYNRMMNDDYSIGISIYGNGGMNTDYDKATYLALMPGSSPTGVDLMQLFIVPTYSRKLNDKHSIGLSPILAYQRFEAKGLDTFGNLGVSSDAAKLTDNDHDNSYGAGVRVGYMGEVIPGLYIGASYQSRTWMSEYDDYAGLFAEQGDFDIPSNWSVGVAYEATSEITLVLDVQQIRYSEVKSINNKLTTTNLLPSSLGTDDGAGFGWEDMTVVKIGAQWQAAPDWIVRAGYSYGEQPIPDSEMLFNIIAPGVIEHHITAGCTKKIGDHQEIDLAIMHALSNDVSGANVFDPSQTIELKMNQWEYTAGYSWKF